MSMKRISTNISKRSEDNGSSDINGDGPGPIIIYSAALLVILVFSAAFFTITGVGETIKDNIKRFQAFLPPLGEVKADFFAQPPRSGNSPLSVQFFNTSIGPIETCLWNFGDTSQIYEGCDISNGVTYRYNKSGTYTVTLQVISQQDEDVEVKENYIVVLQN